MPPPSRLSKSRKKRVKTVRRSTTNEQDKIKYDDEHFHKIPRVLIDQLSSLENLRYRDALQAFGIEYLPKKFTDTSQEYNFINQSLIKLLNASGSTAWDAEIERMMKGDQAGYALNSDYRDHFIHSFQDFLLGALILDRYYDKFSEWYSESLMDNPDTDLETSWLLATVFHDRMRPLKEIGLAAEDMHIEVKVNWKGMDSQYAHCIASAHSHILAKGSLRGWHPPGRLSKTDLSQIVLEFAKKHDHGMLGSFHLLEHASEMRGSLRLATAAEANAALAIALHHRGARSELLKSNIFPLDMEKFPVAALILYCDAAQEWGREARFRQPTCYLLDLIREERRVMAVVSFRTGKDANAKLSEFRSVKRCFRCKDIQFLFRAVRDATI